MKTFSTRPSDVRREWRVIDANGQPLGRLATQVAIYLRGKHKPIYAPHLDVGDFVIVVNASQVRLTGRKLEQKKYYHHSGYPGGLKVREVKHELQTRPERVIERAVRGMLPRGPLGLHLFNHLKVYGGADHPHEAQVHAKIVPWMASPPGSNTPDAPAVAGTEPAPVAEAQPPAMAVATAAPALAVPVAEPQLPAPEAELALPAPEPEAALPTPSEEPSSPEEPQA
jgi:large subunit ribosomal protein L13